VVIVIVGDRWVMAAAITVSSWRWQLSADSARCDWGAGGAAVVAAVCCRLTDGVGSGGWCSQWTEGRLRARPRE